MPVVLSANAIHNRYTDLATMQQDYMPTFVTNKSYSFMKIIHNSMHSAGKTIMMTTQASKDTRYIYTRYYIVYMLSKHTCSTMYTYMLKT